MKSADRKKLKDAVNGGLPPGYACEEYDDFLNYEWVSGDSSRSCRVVRLIGVQRAVMIFSHIDDPTKTLRSPRYNTFYVRGGEAHTFDAKSLYAGSNSDMNFERFISDWLKKRRALSFHGTNWVGRYAEFLVRFIPRWEKEFSGIERFKTPAWTCSKCGAIVTSSQKTCGICGHKRTQS